MTTATRYRPTPWLTDAERAAERRLFDVARAKARLDEAWAAHTNSGDAPAADRDKARARWYSAWMRYRRLTNA